MDNKLNWEQVTYEINKAFKNVKLGKGIGYYEAGALDMYLSPNSPEHLKIKKKDERNNWKKLFTELNCIDYDIDRHCFMDKKGLLFYLPVLLLKKDNAVEFMLEQFISVLYKREGYFKNPYYELFTALTEQQKHCIYLYYKYLNSINFPEFETETLNYRYQSGEAIFNGFDFIKFLETHFNPDYVLENRNEA